MELKNRFTPTAKWEIETRNRFEILTNLLDEAEKDDSRDMGRIKSSAWTMEENEANENARGNNVHDTIPVRMTINMTRLKIERAKCKILSIMCDIMKMNVIKRDFQSMASRFPQDSLSLLTDQKSPELEEGSQMSQPSQASQEKEWECPWIACNKVYKFEKGLQNHIKRVHDGKDDLLEGANNHREVSKTDEVFSEEDDYGRKRKWEELDDYSDNEEEEKGERTKARLVSIREEDEFPENGSVDMGLLDSSPRSTQEIHDVAKRAYAKAEKVDVDVGLMDDSAEEERLDLEELKKTLKSKESLLNIRNSELAEFEAKIEELKESHEILESSLTKVQNSRAEEMRKARAEMEVRDKVIKELRSKNLAKTNQRAKSPAKEKLKDELSRSSTKMVELAGRIEKLQTDLKKSQAEKKKAEIDAKKYERMKISLDETMLEMDNIKRDLEEYRKEMAKARKKIPCTKPGCNTPRECEFSHLLKYEDRSEPRDPSWRKNVPCRYFNHPDGCKYSSEECSFSHERRNGDERRRSPSLEILEETAGPSERRQDRFQRVPPPKRRRFTTSWREEAERKEEMSGNGSGAGGRPHHSALGQHQNSRRNSMSSSGNVGGQMNNNGVVKGRVSRDRSVRRQFSPIRSPEEKVNHQRWGSQQEDLRPRLEARRGRMRSQSRGPRARNSVGQEPRFSRFQGERERGRKESSGARMN